MRSLCVYCGSSDSVHTNYFEGAKLMGRVLAENGIELVYGGGKTGLMGAVADGAIASGGVVRGVIVESMNTQALAHQGLASLEVTDSMQHRKWRMFEMSDGFIAMPGGYGTFDELFETVTWAQIGVHEKPIGLLNLRDYFKPLWEMVKHAEQEGFIYKEHTDMLFMSADPSQLIGMMRLHEPNRDAVNRWMRK
mgnify:CR=1 FL=1